MKYKKVGLALGSGGLRGLVHIGVIKTLQKHNIPIHAVSGSSAGALVGAYFARFGEVDTLEATILKNRKEMLSLFLDLGIHGGLVSGKKIHSFLEKLFHRSDFIDTQIPLYVIATNLVDGKKVVFHSGRIAPAVQGSIAVPVLFKPVKTKEKVLVDGGLSDPVPVNILKEKKVDTVIAVNLYHKNEFKNISISFSHVALRSVRIALHNLAKTAVVDADVVINADASAFEEKSFLNRLQEENIKKLIAMGEKEALKMLPQIKKALK